MRRSPPRPSDRRHEWITGAAVTLMVCAGLGVVLAGGYALTVKPHAAAWGDARPANGPSKEEFRTASVLFVPMRGNICRQRVIDNETWRIQDAGSIVCDEAVSWNSGMPSKAHLVAVRVDAIRSGFRSK